MLPDAAMVKLPASFCCSYGAEQIFPRLQGAMGKKVAGTKNQKCDDFSN